LGGANYPKMVVIHGGGCEPTPEGIGFPHFAQEVGNLARAEC
jgi:hypothetical protein